MISISVKNEIGERGWRKWTRGKTEATAGLEQNASANPQKLDLARRVSPRRAGSIGPDADHPGRSMSVGGISRDISPPYFLHGIVALVNLRQFCLFSFS